MHDSLKILASVTAAYIEAAYFTDAGLDSDIQAGADMHPAARFRAAETCADFLAQCEEAGLLDLYRETGRTWDSFGHDLWLTRNRHGAGFWDRGMGALGEALSEQARNLGTTYLVQD